MKRCGRCGEIKPLDAFARSRKSKDGRHAYCQSCSTAYVKEWRANNPTRPAEHARRVVTDPAKRRANAMRSADRHPDHVVARRAVARAIKQGVLPPLGSESCTDCGGPANRYDHHLGYTPAHHLDVEPVCYSCDGRRSIQRGEHATSGPERKHV